MGIVENTSGAFTDDCPGCCWRGSIQGQLGKGLTPPGRQTNGDVGHGVLVVVVVVLLLLLLPVVEVLLLVLVELLVLVVVTAAVVLVVVLSVVGGSGGVMGVCGNGGVGENVGITADVDVNEVVSGGPAGGAKAGN